MICGVFQVVLFVQSIIDIFKVKLCGRSGLEWINRDIYTVINNKWNISIIAYSFHPLTN